MPPVCPSGNQHNRTEVPSQINELKTYLLTNLIMLQTLEQRFLQFCKEKLKTSTPQVQQALIF